MFTTLTQADRPGSVQKNGRMTRPVEAATPRPLHKPSAFAVFHFAGKKHFLNIIKNAIPRQFPDKERIPAPL